MIFNIHNLRCKERTSMSTTFHLSLDVPDLERSVEFYSQLFGREPAKRRAGYAKFELADPPVALALQQAARPALSHLGIRVSDSEQVERAGERLREGGLVTLDERDTSCCYARQDKVWVSDPAGNRWEVYTVLEDVEEDDDHDAPHAGAACCTPASACCT
jgi:catechol 2,3-dioxygenase-like lactoylglutathione lyase family enzyme